MIITTRLRILLLSFLLIANTAQASINKCVRYPAGSPVECIDSTGVGAVRSVTAGDGSITASPTIGDVILSGAGYWAPTNGNIFNPSSLTPTTGTRVTVGSSTHSYDTFTVNSSTGGETINAISASGIGGIDQYTKIMLHASNDIIDSSFVPNTFTNVGSVAFTSGTGFGDGYAFTFNGGGTKSLTTPANTAFDLGSADWTFDTRFTWTTHTATGIFASQGTDGNNYMGWFWSSGASGLNFQVVSSGSVTQRFHAAFTPVNGTAYHITFVRSGSSGLIFVNGVSQTVTIDNALGTVAHYTGTFNIGKNALLGSDPDGIMQEVRFSPGTARWTAGFTPPATPYTSTAASSVLIFSSNGTANGNITFNNATGNATITNNSIVSQTIDSTGSTTFGNDINTSTHNIVTDTSTGTKLGTSTSQKIGFFNATPIVQPGATTDLGVVMSNIGLRPAGTAYPITTSGYVTLLGTGGTPNTIDFGNNFGGPALYLFNNGVANRWGWGLNAGEMQFFGASSTGNRFSWNKGGDFQSSGTNELMRLSQTAAGKGALGPNNLSPQTYLDIGGTAASASVGVEDQFYITRPVSGGVSFPEMFGISVGRYVAPTSFSPNSRVDFKLKNDSTSTLVPDITVMTMQSDGKVGIGGTLPISQLTIQQPSSGTANTFGLTFDGTGISGGTDTTDGLFFGLGFTGANNRQFWVGQRSDVGVSTTKGMFRMLLGSAFAQMDSVSGNGGTRFYLNLGTDTTGVVVGSTFADSTTTGLDTSKLGVHLGNTEAAIKGLVIKTDAVSPTADLIKVENSSGNNLHSVGPTGKVTIANGAGIVFTGTAPTVANNDCGTTVQGTVTTKSSNNAGSVTAGTLTVTSCAVTFNTVVPYVNAPFCTCMDASNILGVKCTSSTTKLTITSSVSMSGDVIAWTCFSGE